MFKKLRRQLALQFIAISVIAYLLSLGVGSALFYTTLESNVRSELTEHLDAIKPLLDLRTPIPRWKSRPPVISQSLSIQLFDSSGKLIDQIGDSTTHRLYERHQDFISSDKKWCIISSPLHRGQNVIGYLQIQTDIKRIDDGLRGWLIGTLVITVTLLGGLILAAIVVSFRAVQPVEQSSKELQQFMADAGHELDTPLAIIQANAETLVDRVADSEEDSRIVEIINRTAEHMGILVHDLRLLATTDLSSKQTDFVSVPLHELVEDTVEDFTKLYQDKGIKLSLPKLDHCIVKGNPGDLQRLLANLLKNALTYTEPGGSVTVELRLAGRQIELVVSDTGIGIPAACLEQVFSRFYRVDSSRSKASGGTGLGLCIVQKIATDHRGQASVSSELGKGSTFAVCLPAKANGSHSEPSALSPSG